MFITNVYYHVDSDLDNEHQTASIPAFFIIALGYGSLLTVY
jgi:hypothetical protein